jgi:hypothetical protein
MATARRAGARAGRRAYWRRQVEAHRRSGLSQAAFCAQQGLRKGTLSFWRWKLAREARAAARPDATSPRHTASAAPFIPIQLAAVQAAHDESTRPTPPDGIEIELTVGAAHRLRVRGRVDAAWLVQVLRGLEGPGC